MVHAGERFVEQQDFGVGGEPDGDAERAQMALRQCARQLACDRAEAEESENLVRGTGEIYLIRASGL